MVTLEKGKERRLGTGGTLDATETNVVACALDVAQVPEELLFGGTGGGKLTIIRIPRHIVATDLNPEGRTLADRGQLRRLEVSPPERREVLVRLGETGETLDDDGELREDDVACVAEEDQVGVVGDVARGGAEVDNTGGGGSTLAKDVDVRHDIVTALLLLDGRVCHLGLVEVLFKA